MRVPVVIGIFAIVASTAAAGPQFEVASVKPSAMPPVHIAYTMSDARVDIAPMGLKYLIQLAYGVEAYQIDGPDWIATTRFDILAKLPAGSTKGQIPEMLQALLADRFGLVFHREPREQQIYALLVGKGGPKLKEAAADNTHSDDPAFRTGRRIMTKYDTEDGFWSVSLVDGRRVFDAPRITMTELARMLMPFVEEPVVDLTGLKGAWQVVALEVPQEVRFAAMLPPRPAGTASDPDGGVSLFSSVQKLGLSLEKRKAPVEHLIVDHAERTPKEN
jgi:uncharacterized protein (TIGR03435 family)